MSVSTSTPTTFLELGVPEALAAVLAKRGISAPTTIQAGVYPAAAAGKDVLARSRTGSGKTLAFGLPMLSRLDPKLPTTQLLVLTPTRELAVQVATELQDVAGKSNLQVTAVTGGASMTKQIRELKTSQVVVGTPGRIIDHLGRKTLQIKTLRALVLDEGDEMLDLGFLEDIQKVLELIPDDCQRMLFSATLPPAMKKVISDYLRKPVLVEADSAGKAHADIRHVMYAVRAPDRGKALANILLHEEIDRVLVFTQTRVDSQAVTERLVNEGFGAAFLNGDLSQDQRTQAMNAFRSGSTKILVATDVAARGLDVQGISHLINYSLPTNSDTYVHRSGRTGRAGATGVSISLVSPFERGKAARLTYGAHLSIAWKAVPTRNEIKDVRTNRLKASLLEESATPAGDYIEKFANELLSEIEPKALVATLLKRIQGKFHPGYDMLAEAFSPQSGSRDRAPADRDRGPVVTRQRLTKRTDREDARPEASPRGEVRKPDVRSPRGEVRSPYGDTRAPREEHKLRKTHEDRPLRGARPDRAMAVDGGRTRIGKEAGMETFRIPLGHRQNINPGSLINILCQNTSLKGEDLGKITIQTNYTFFDVRTSAAGKLTKKSTFQVGGKEVKVLPAGAADKKGKSSARA